MAIFASANFNAIGNGTSISGTTLDNGLGGSGTRTFVSNGSAALVGDGAGALSGGATAWTNVAPGQADYRATFKFNPSGDTSAIQLTGRKNTTTGNASYYGLRLAPGHTSLVIWEGDGTTGTPPFGTSRVSQSLTAPATPIYLQADFDGEDLTGRVIRVSDDVTLATVTYTFSAGLTGTNLAFGFADSGGTGLIDDLILEDLPATSQTLEPPLLTNTQAFYSPTVTGGAAPQILAPSLLTNSQTFYSPSVAVVGFTAAYILANTGPVGANPAGFMYEVAGLVDPDDYMTYTTVSGPTPGGGTLDDSARDGTFTYTGGAPAIWVVQIQINGVDYPDTTTVYLYDQEFTLLPPLLVNTQTFFSPTVTGGGAISLLPPLLVNTQTFYRPTITGGIPAPAPVFGRSGSKIAAQIAQPICRPIVRPMT